MKINITEEGKKAILDKVNFKKDEKNVRIYVSGVGWGGPVFGIALDDAKENDYVENKEAFNVSIEKDLIETFKGFTIDFIESWAGKRFYVTPAIGGSTC